MPEAITSTDIAFVWAHWGNLDSEMQEAMLADRLRLLRWMKHLLKVSNSRFALTFLYDLCRKALSKCFSAPAGAFNTP